MIASTVAAAVLAAASPEQAPVVHNMAALAGQAAQAAPMAKDAAKMDCCKDGCACCGNKDAAKIADTSPTR